MTLLFLCCTLLTIDSGYARIGIPNETPDIMANPSANWAVHLACIAPALEVIAAWIDELAFYMCDEVNVEIVAFDNGSSDYDKHTYLVVIPDNGEVGDEYVELYRDEDGAPRIRPVEADEDMQDVLYPYGLDWIDGEIFNCGQDWASFAGREYDEETRMVVDPVPIAIALTRPVAV